MKNRNHYQNFSLPQEELLMERLRSRIQWEKIQKLDRFGESRQEEFERYLKELPDSNPTISELVHSAVSQALDSQQNEYEFYVKEVGGDRISNAYFGAMHHNRKLIFLVGAHLTDKLSFKFVKFLSVHELSHFLLGHGEEDLMEEMRNALVGAEFKESADFFFDEVFGFRWPQVLELYYMILQLQEIAADALAGSLMGEYRGLAQSQSEYAQIFSKKKDSIQAQNAKFLRRFNPEKGRWKRFSEDEIFSTHPPLDVGVGLLLGLEEESHGENDFLWNESRLEMIDQMYRLEDL